MDLSNIQPAPGSVKRSTRIGRGPGSGKGGTSTRGHKGAKSRSGYSRKIGFEGGQMPLQRRLPNLDTLAQLAESRQLQKIGIEELRAAGYIRRGQLVKILAGGAINTALTVEANAFSEAAKAAIEAAGGTANKI